MGHQRRVNEVTTANTVPLPAHVQGVTLDVRERSACVSLAALKHEFVKQGLGRGGKIEPADLPTQCARPHRAADEELGHHELWQGRCAHRFYFSADIRGKEHKCSVR